MWSKLHYLALFICLVCGRSLNMSAGEVHDYMTQYRQTLIADYARETTILSGYSLEQLLEELDAFYSDTLPEVQQKAYYFTYKKSQIPFVSRTVAVERLVKGLVDAGGGTVGQLLGYLRGFSPADFNERTRAVVFARLHYTKTPHYGDLVRLAGYLGVGEEELYRYYLTPDLPVKEKWN